MTTRASRNQHDPDDLAFAAAVIVRYVWILSHLLRGEEPEQIDLTKSSSGL